MVRALALLYWNKAWLPVHTIIPYPLGPAWAHRMQRIQTMAAETDRSFPAAVMVVAFAPEEHMLKGWR